MRKPKPKDEIVTLLRSNRGKSYVYRLHRPDGTPFYVGQGMGRRLFFHESEALGPSLSYKLNIIRRIVQDGGKVLYSLEGFYDSREECSGKEIAEIRRIGSHDLGTGPLANLTDGGEGTVGLSEDTRRRIDAELHGPDAPGDRGVANRFFLKLCKEVRSVPIRPTSSFVAQKPVPHRQPRRPTPRMAAALAASAILNRVMLEPGCVIPRNMTTPEGARLAIENGASADLLRSGMAALVPSKTKGSESFRLDARGCELLIDLIGRDLLLDAGIVMPHFDAGRARKTSTRKAKSRGYQAKFDKADRGNPWLNDPGDETTLTEAETFELLRDTGTKPEQLRDKAKGDRYKEWLKTNPATED